jgi:hypothetical protein
MRLGKEERMRAGATVFLMALILPATVAASEPSKAKVHGYALSGTVVALDEAAKTFDVRTSPKRQTRLSWTTATVVLGGSLAVGQKVTLRYLDKDQKHIATSIKIMPAVEAARATTPSATPAPAR